MKRVKKVLQRVSIFLFSALFSITLSANSCSGEISQDRPTVENFLGPTKIVEHILGQTEVPLNPQRVVVLDGEGFLLDSILSLGIKPIGLPRCSDCLHSDKFSEFVGDVQVIGTKDRPSLEKILELKPDLILAYDWQKNLYQRLSKIAPTVLVGAEDDEFKFKEDFIYLAEILTKTDEGKEILRDYNNRVEKLRQQVGEQLEGKKVSLLSYWGSTVHVYKQELLSYAQVMSDLGVQFIDAYENLEVPYLKLSIEAVPEWDADFLFVQFYYEEDFEGIDSLPFFEEAVWSELTAVQKNQMHVVKWVGEGGPMAANKVIDDLYEYFSNVS